MAPAPAAAGEQCSTDALQRLLPLPRLPHARGTAICCGAVDARRDPLSDCYRWRLGLTPGTSRCLKQRLAWACSPVRAASLDSVVPCCTHVVWPCGCELVNLTSSHFVRLQ